MTTIDLKATKRIHLIAIGGAVMHNLGLALKAMGHIVTGSDDAFHDPSKTRLESAGFSTAPGWFEDRITADLDLVILGMHARKDNPELVKALGLGLVVVSFPEFVGLMSQEKLRISVAGSHGKTTTTSMIMHALKKLGIAHDYLVGAQLPGYETMVSITDAPIIVIESDEYLSSCLDPRPKMLHYHPQIAILTGLEWDHMNVFPTLASYEAAFSSFIRSMPTGSVLLFDSDDPALTRLVLGERHPDARPYKAFEADYKDDRSVIQAEGRAFEMGIFGKHNFSNLKAAALVAREIGIPESDFLAAMSDFKGAQKRMQIVHQSDELIIIQDFAHAPSKVRATALAVKERYPDHSLTAVLELHTFSSLNPEFLPEYKGSLDPAEERLVMYVPGSSDHKKLPRLADSDIRRAFNDDGLQIAHDRDELTDMIKKKEGIKQVILLMSSGYWGGGNFEDLLSKLRAD